MKKITAFLLVLVLIAAGFVSCDRSGNAEAVGSEAATDGDTVAISPDTTEATGADSAGGTSETVSADTSKQTEGTAVDETDRATEESSETVSDETDKKEGDSTVTKEPINVLFIGNSFTYYNSMPSEIFAGICASAGVKVTVDQVTKGAWNLYKFSSENDEMGSQVHQKLKNKKYDIVVIQEQSSTPIKSPGQFYTSVRRMLELIEANGAKPVLFETWGYHEDYSKTAECGGSTGVMEMKLRAAYTAIGEELGIDVAYAGAAMLDAYKNQGLNVYDADLHHSSVIGSTVTAFTIFSHIFNTDPRTVAYTGGLQDSVAAKIKESAYKATFGDHSVDPSYKTSSVGVELSLKSDVDISKTKNLTSMPSSSVISYVTRNSAETGNGWTAMKLDSTKTFSGIRGTKDAIAATTVIGELTHEQKLDIADIGYGVSVIGVQSIGKDNAVANLVNGHWGSSFMGNMTFDSKKYDVSGAESANGEFTALITLNFGASYTFEAMGYMSGSIYGFPQIQKVYVSDDGVNWTLVESACYDAAHLELGGGKLFDIDNTLGDPWNNNKATATVLFDMEGVSGQYIRIGVIAGRVLNSSALSVDLSAIQDINTREIIVFGEKKN